MDLELDSETLDSVVNIYKATVGKMIEIPSIFTFFYRPEARYKLMHFPLLLRICSLIFWQRGDSEASSMTRNTATLQILTLMSIEFVEADGRMVQLIKSSPAYESFLGYPPFSSFYARYGILISKKIGLLMQDLKSDNKRRVYSSIGEIDNLDGFFSDATDRARGLVSVVVSAQKAVQNCFLKTVVNSLLLILCSQSKEKDVYLKLMRTRLVLRILVRYLSQFEDCTHVHQYIISHLICSHASTTALKSMEEAPQADAVIISPEISDEATEVYRHIYSKTLDVSSIYSRKYDEEVCNRFAIENDIEIDTADRDLEEQTRNRGRSHALLTRRSLLGDIQLEQKKNSTEWVDITADGSKSRISIEFDQKTSPLKPSPEKKSLGFFGNICKLLVTAVSIFRSSSTTDPGALVACNQPTRKNSEDSFKKMLSDKDAKLPDQLYKALKLDSKNIDMNFRTFIKQLCRNSSALPLNIMADTNSDVENHFGDFSLEGGLPNKVADAFRSVLLTTDSSLTVIAAKAVGLILKHALMKSNRHLLLSIRNQVFTLDGCVSKRFFTSAAEVLVDVFAK